ncbi:MAG: GtrA family protein, partial [Acidimicrobiia bacterium]|nr:GtrA family protein [Acidimicrobiia bacterium]
RVIRTLVRYSGVSVVATLVSLAVLGALVATGAMTPGWANVVATAVGTVPSFELNRRWVWRCDGTPLVRQVVPFATLSLAGLGLSTVAVHAAETWATSLAFAPVIRTAVAEGAHLAAFGSLWILQFVLLDRILFAHDHSQVALSQVPVEQPKVPA